MLSEHPNVRVHNDPLRMCPARESRLWRDAKRQGRLFFGSFLWSEQRNEQKNFNFLVYGLRRNDGRAVFMIEYE
jgi:hypothetical protein